ncbi:sodium/proton-translocating pyrophosphatase [Georgenia sp. SUBG003]|uniref:sodium/proton-translocating pyrophosphatase n=1 Tax=Georgenia sp. SUBG003 TaxID=1497974 RepID=UPI003AB21BC6
MTIAVDSYGPVTDNAQSVYELSMIEEIAGVEDEIRREHGFEVRWDRGKQMLEENDGAGNTFKATAKPVLIGTAVVGATTMIFSIVMALTDGLTTDLENLSIMHPPFLLGIVTGGAVIYWFTGASIQAVTTGAYRALEFIRRTIRIDDDAARASTEDSRRVVEICTQYAQKGMLNMFLGVFFGTLAFAFVEPYFFIGYLVSIAVFGLYQSIFMANAGGAWDNAKKIVEVDLHAKGTALHDATIVGDTVGDPYKDTSSVALNPVIKFTTLFGLLAVELAVSLTAQGRHTLVLALAATFFAVMVVFVLRSFYGMRIRTSLAGDGADLAARAHSTTTSPSPPDPRPPAPDGSAWQPRRGPREAGPGAPRVPAVDDPQEDGATPPERDGQPGSHAVRTRLRTLGNRSRPVRPEMRSTSEDPGAWGSLGVVELLTALREVGRARPDLEVILRGAEREQSMYRLGPIAERLLDPEVFVPARVASSGITLRVAVVSLESGELRYVTETGDLLDREGRPLGGRPVDLVDAVRASCAIPAVLPPVRLGEDHYVDGGVREALPVEVAVEQLGVTRCFAVVASPPGVPPEESYAGRDMLSIVLRSTAGIMSDEGLHDEVAWARRAGAVVIGPELDVHDVLTVDPGLTAISMDYGYMRAAEAVRGAGPAESRLVRDITALRKEIWQLEVDLLGPAGPDGLEAPDGRPDGEAGRGTSSRGAGTSADGDTGRATPDLTELVDLKRSLRALVDRMPLDYLPPGARSWWRGFEEHAFAVDVVPDWAAPAHDVARARTGR